MARIPLALARPALESGSLVHYPQGGGPVGAAVAGLGEEIAGLAAHLEDRRRRRETFDAAQREQEFLDELERVEVEAAGRAPPDGEGLHDAVYAAAGVAEYWVIDVTNRLVIVHRQPAGAAYATRVQYGPADAVPFALAGAHIADIPAAELLG